MENTISLITYTNSVMKDAWPIYFSQIDRHMPGMKSFVFSDISSSDFAGHTFLEYDNKDPYFKQYLDCLSQVKEDFVIYMQEDFFLYEDVDLEKIKSYVEFLRKNDEYSYVRLIRCGYVEDTRGAADIDNHVGSDLYAVDIDSTDSFSMQPTLWRKDRLVELYDHVKSVKWFEAQHWFDGCKELDTKGVMTYNGEEKRGRYHYDSSVFPYTCTGITKGRWNMEAYSDFLSEMFKKHDIDPYERGMRLSRNYYTK